MDYHGPIKDPDYCRYLDTPLIFLKQVACIDIICGTLYNLFTLQSVMIDT